MHAERHGGKKTTMVLSFACDNGENLGMCNDLQPFRWKSSQHVHKRLQEDDIRCMSILDLLKITTCFIYAILMRRMYNQDAR